MHPMSEVWRCCGAIDTEARFAVSSQSSAEPHTTVPGHIEVMIAKVNRPVWDTPQSPHIHTQTALKAQRMRSKRGASGCDSVRDHATGCESRRFGPQKRKSRKLASVGSLRDNLRLSATWCETTRLSAKVAEEGFEPPTRGL